MKTPRLLSGVLVSMVLTAAGALPAAAQLASLDPPYLGYYAVFATKRFEFGMTSLGKITLETLNTKGEPIAKQFAIPITFVVEEVLPDGKIVARQIKSDSLNSAQPATDKLSKAVITGKSAGEAEFEVTLEQFHGAISLGGRVVNPGTLKNPLRIAFSVKVPPAYQEKRGVAKDAKKEQKELEKKLKSDRVNVKSADGKATKYTYETSVDASSKEINGTGIAAVEVDVSTYQGKKMLFAASTNSALTLANAKPAPLSEGFTINWRPDTAKDPAGKARFNIDVK